MKDKSKSFCSAAESEFKKISEKIISYHNKRIRLDEMLKQEIPRAAMQWFTGDSSPVLNRDEILRCMKDVDFHPCELRRIRLEDCHSKLDFLEFYDKGGAEMKFLIDFAGDRASEYIKNGHRHPEHLWGTNNGGLVIAKFKSDNYYVQPIPEVDESPYYFIKTDFSDYNI
ncbi:hypothetical protein ACPF04_05670 [Campylobacter sp. MOP51]|uniref:hypothetical protein n=1 Tax=Campylobacter canis TaxID=3378588 RepID=UPI003C5DF610